MTRADMKCDHPNVNPHERRGSRREADFSSSWSRGAHKLFLLESISSHGSEDGSYDGQIPAENTSLFRKADLPPKHLLCMLAEQKNKGVFLVKRAALRRAMCSCLRPIAGFLLIFTRSFHLRIGCPCPRVMLSTERSSVTTFRTRNACDWFL